MGHDFWSITYEDSTQLSYDIVDLIFLNDQYCHFRQSLYDVISFCKSDDKPCAPSLVLQNL